MLTTTEVQVKLKIISDLAKTNPEDKDIVAFTNTSIATTNKLIKEIEEGGWHLQAQAYSRQVLWSKKCHNKLLKKPRKEWRVRIYYVSSSENKVEYFDGVADNKRAALETQARYP